MKTRQQAPTPKTAAALLAAVLVPLVLAGCGEAAKLTPELTTGPRPQLVEPNKTLIPTVNVAPVVGWNDTAAPTPISTPAESRPAVPLASSTPATARP